MFPADNSYRNYEICGGWAAKSPIYAAKLSRYGIGDIESDLLNMNNLFFVTRVDRGTEWLEEYYRCKGYNVRVAREDTLLFRGERRFVICKLYFDYETGRGGSHGIQQQTYQKAYED